MKRLIAILLCIVTIASSFSCLVGCSKSEDAIITKGEWLALLTDGFGMYSYTNTEPYSNTVDAENEYFPYVQMAFEWDIINDKNIDVNEKVTKGYLAETLVKCVGTVDTSEMSVDDILEYAVENNYVSFKYRGRTDSIRHVTFKEASNSIGLSLEKWTNRTIETKETVMVGEEVVNFADGILTSEQVHVDEGNGTVMIPESAVSQLENGDTFIVPKNNVDSTAAAYQVEKIEYKDGYAIITTNSASVENTIQDLKFSGSTEADLLNVPITDGLGNVINATAITGTSYNVSKKENINLSYLSNDEHKITSCSQMELGFEIDGLEVAGSVSDNSISFSIKGEIPLDKKGKKKVTVGKSYSIEDISLDYDWDIEWFKLKSAYAKLNYTTVDTTSISSKWEKEGAVDFDHRKKPTLANILNSEIRESAAAKGAKTITICSFPIVNGGVGRIDVDIKAKISVTGSVELIVTTRNSNGIEYKNGNLRYIKAKSNDVDLNIKAKIEGTLYAGVSIKALKMNLLGIGFEAGIGVEFTAIAHLVNSDNVEIDQMSVDGSGEVVEATVNSVQNITYEEKGKTLTAHVDVCGDITTYFILRFKFDDDCAIAELLNGKTDKSGGVIKLEIEIFGKDNARIDALCTHVEEWKFIESCTRKYNSIDDVEEEAKEGTATDSDANAESDETLDIDTYFLNLLVGKTAVLDVTELPKGYKESDLIYSSSDTEVVTIDSNGKITAIKEGTAEVTVSIPNTSIEIKCSIVVSSVGKEVSSETGISENEVKL